MKRAPRHGGMPSSISALLFASSIFLALALSSCASKDAVTDSPNPRLKTATIQVGGASVIAEIARTETERQRGLMFRKSLDEGKGMLFIFDKDERLAFWMKNTILPLSIAYIASDGTIRQILDLEPQSLAAVQAERSVRYALEMPRGWFDRAGVHAGDKVELGGLHKAGLD
jgi:uncharacterized protein